MDGSAEVHFMRANQKALPSHTAQFGQRFTRTHAAAVDHEVLAAVLIPRRAEFNLDAGIARRIEQERQRTRRFHVCLFRVVQPG